MSSAQVIRNVQSHFNPSSHFAPWVSQRSAELNRESSYQHRRRRASKRALQVKIGHGGTLDPAATGVLILGVGYGTKALPDFLSCTKTYEAVVLFGAATDSYDGEGKVVGKRDHSHITRAMVEEALGRFRGKFMQRPPIFSALSVDGKRLYEYAREGKELPREIEERPVEVENIELVEWMEGGTHEYKWPTEEAPVEEKAVAEKLLAVDSHGSSEEVPAASAISSGSPNLKRKRNDDDQTNDIDGAVSSPPRTKHKTEEDPEIDAEPEPVMSGALPASPTPCAAADSSSAPPSQTTPKASPLRDGRGPPAARLTMTSSRGFYVRSLCHDLGQAVGSYGLMAHLVRSRQGDFQLGTKDVFEYEDLEKGEDCWAPTIERLLKAWDEQHR